jgi:translation initiation factor 1 (eIF-1/SUI1)
MNRPRKRKEITTIESTVDLAPSAKRRNLRLPLTRAVRAGDVSSIADWLAAADDDETTRLKLESDSDVDSFYEFDASEDDVDADSNDDDDDNYDDNDDGFDDNLPTRKMKATFARACFAGQRPIVDLLLTKAEWTSDDWNRGLMYACGGSQPAIVNFLISNGASNFNRGLFGACLFGQPAMAELMIAKGANDWNSGLHAAARQYPAIVELMIANGANDWNRALPTAVDGINFPTVALLLSKGADAASVLSWPRDSDFLFDLLTTTSIPRSLLAAVSGIDRSFARVDRVAAELRDRLADGPLVSDLYPVIAAYCGLVVNP